MVTLKIPQRFNTIASLMIAVILLLVPVLSTKAQVSDNNWEVPTNVSRSGSADSPRMVVDSDGIIYLFWKDEFAGYKYAQSSETGWTEPANISAPFSENNSDLKLAIDSTNTIHAVWIDNVSKRLMYSSTRIKSLMPQVTWLQRMYLASSVLAFNMEIDGNDRVHIAFIQSEDLNQKPAGVYYLSFAGSPQTDTTLLFTSPYFRIGDAGSGVQEETTVLPSLDISILQKDEQSTVAVIWSIPQTRRVYMIQSTNQRDWDNAIELETPAEMPGGAVPQYVKLKFTDQQVIAIWQAHQSGESCVAYFRYSDDEGKNWSPRQVVFPDINSCIENSQIFVEPGQPVLLYTEMNQVIHLSTWDNASWSTPAPQNTVNSFIDTETLNAVDLSCFQPIIQGGRILISGCDRGIGGDIWIIAGSINRLLVQEENTTGWARLKVLRANSSQYNSPALIASGDEFHAFWSQPSSIESTDYGVEIYHSIFEKEGEVSTALILASPSGRADPLTVDMDDEQHLLVVWNGGATGDSYFSQAHADFSRSPTEWSSPILIHPDRTRTYQPQVYAGANNRIYVAYATPINEARGIYLTTTDDLGQTWSSPVQAFDATQEDCEMLDQVKLQLTGNETIHISWVCQTQPGGIGAVALWSVHSKDQGSTWSSPIMVSARKVLWSQLIATRGDIAHLLWKDYANGRIHFWHAVFSSEDDLWRPPEQITSLDGDVGTTGAAIDSAQQVYLVHFSNMLNQSTLNFWWWNGSIWISGEPFELRREHINDVQNLSVLLTSQGQLSVLFSARQAAEGQNYPILFFTSLQLEIPDNPVISIPTADAQLAAPTAQLVPTVTPTVAIAPTATLDISTIDTSSPVQSNTWGGIILGIALVTILIAGVVIIEARKKLRGEV